MAVARAFPYARYNPDVAGDPGRLLAPPYDVVDDAARERIAAASPYQSMLLELPEGGDNAKAGELLRSWLDQDVLELGEVGVAVVQQRYVGPDGVRRTRLSVCCEVGLSEFGEGNVLPHERTFDGPRRTRLELMQQTGANISPVFLLYNDPERSVFDIFASVTDTPPDFTANEEDGTQTAVWFVTDVALCELFEAAVSPHPLLIADGHHRYTAALAYRELARAGGPKLSLVGGTEHDGAPVTSTSGPDGVLAMVANSADPGICVFPTHRILRGASMKHLDDFVLGSGAFRVDVHSDADDALFGLEQLKVPGFVVVGGGRARLFSVPDPDDLLLASPDTGAAYRSLDVVALHTLVLDGGALLAESGTVGYTRSLDEALDAAREDGTIVFLLRGIDPAIVHEVAADGDLMPQKSTYYFPKVPTGVAFRLLDLP